MRASRVRDLLLSCTLALSLLSMPLAASADDYDEDKAGHPLRVLGYILYPVGFLISTLIVKPAHWVGSQEPLSTLFGHEED